MGKISTNEFERNYNRKIAKVEEKKRKLQNEYQNKRKEEEDKITFKPQVNHQASNISIRKVEDRLYDIAMKTQKKHEAKAKMQQYGFKPNLTKSKNTSPIPGKKNNTDLMQFIGKATKKVERTKTPPHNKFFEPLDVAQET